MTRIAGVGAYVPRFRLPAEAVEEAWGGYGPRGVEAVAVPDADEDALTMGVAAAERALAAAGADPDEVGWVGLATTTPPLAEGDLTARLRSALGVPADASSREFRGITRAGVDAVVAAADRAEPALAVAADRPRGAPDDALDHGAGAGAAAFLLTEDGTAAVVDSATRVDPYPGTRFRPAGDDRTRGLGVRQYDRDAYRALVTGAVEGVDVGAVDAAVLGAPDADLPERVRGDLGLDRATVEAGLVVDRVGDAGAATAPLGLARALDDGAERVLVVGHGSGGGATAVVVEGPTPVDAALEPTEPVDYADALRRRGTLGGEEPAGGGAYVSVATWRRTIDARHRLVAGRCVSCGDLAFPGEGACPSCDERKGYERVRLTGRGTVEAATRIVGGEPPEFAVQRTRSGPYGCAVVAFDGPDGGTASAPAQVADGLSVDRGDEVRAVFRRVYTQEELPRYGRKVVPVGERY